MQTRVFDLAPEHGYKSLRALARAMGRDVAELSRVKNHERGVSAGFIEGALRAFPGKSFDDLFITESNDTDAA